MDEKEKLPEFDLEDILKEFSSQADPAEEDSLAQEPTEEEVLSAEEEIKEFLPSQEKKEAAPEAVTAETIRMELPVTEQTIRMEVPAREKAPTNEADASDTIRLPDLGELDTEAKPAP